MQQTLRRVGKSIIVTLPEIFIERNRLKDESRVELHVRGGTLLIEAKIRRRYKLKNLMAEMPNGFPMIEGWDDMSDVRLECL